MANKTWILEPTPSGQGCQQVYKVKYTLVREMDRYKVRLVVKDFSQVYGVDYCDILATDIDTVKGMS